MSYQDKLPVWLRTLLTTEDYCRSHFPDFFCLQCVEPICSSCKSCDHEFRHKLKIYGYSRKLITEYEAEKLMDCELVESYFQWGCTLVYLNGNDRGQGIRYMPRESWGLCCVCSHNLEKAKNQYCSLACKLNDLHRRGEELSDYIRYKDPERIEPNSVPPPVQNDESKQSVAPPEPVLEPEVSEEVSSGVSEASYALMKP